MPQDPVARRGAAKLLAVVAAVLLLAGCTLLPPASNGSSSIHAQREALIASLVPALERRDAAAIAGMVDPVVDATADIAALIDAHGGIPFEKVEVEWGPLDFGEQARDATIRAVAADGTPHVFSIGVGWDGATARLGLGSVPGGDPGSDIASPTADAEAVWVRLAAEGAVRALFAGVQPPAGYAGAGLSEAEREELRAAASEGLASAFTPELVARYEQMLWNAIDTINAGYWDADTSSVFDWGRVTVDGAHAEVDFLEHRTLVRHSADASPPVWRLDGEWAWTMILESDGGAWRVADFDLECRTACP